MNSEDRLREKIQEELEWNPKFDAKPIGVSVKDGIVTLSGHVSSWSEKTAVEQAVERIKGVKAYVENLTVKIPGEFERTDEEIAEVALKNLRWNMNVPEKGIILRVENGWIHLDGEVQWDFQREAAKNAVKNLMGVKGVISHLKIKESINLNIIKESIKKSFERNAQIDANQVQIEVNGSNIILKGTVQSLAEKKRAERIAYNAPGVQKVENQIQVKIPDLVF